MRVHRLALPLLLALTTLVAGASGASASCLFDDRPLDARIAEAPIVFVGTVTATAHGATTANLRVSEIWKGSGDLREVVVQGGSGQDGMVTSIDRSWTIGERYLVLPFPDGATLIDNACSATTVWSDELAASRPADATMVDPSSPAVAASEGPGVAEFLLIGLALAGLASMAAVVARRRKVAS